jgi:hypothetical protein
LNAIRWAVTENRERITARIMSETTIINGHLLTSRGPDGGYPAMNISHLGESVNVRLHRLWWALNHGFYDPVRNSNGLNENLIVDHIHGNLRCLSCLQQITVGENSSRGRAVAVVQCPIEGCTRNVQSHGLCDSHARKESRATNTTPCSVANCPDMSYSKGMCNTHYKRARQAKVTTPCSIGECTKMSHTGGMCAQHYERQRQAKVTVLCSVGECTKMSCSAGMCNTHYLRHHYAKSTTPCLIGDCQKMSRNVGLCSAHYQRAKKT